MYRYLCTQREPAPGAVPAHPINVDYDQYQTEDPGGHVVYVWGAVEYDRELTQQEICDYELMEAF